MKTLALLGALTLVPLACLSAQAQLVDVDLFPSSTETIVTPAVVAPAQPQLITQPAVVAPAVQPTVITQPAVAAPAILEQKVTVTSPPLTDLQIKAMPSTVDPAKVIIETTR